jgi:hypothetical protein
MLQSPQRLPLVLSIGFMYQLVNYDHCQIKPRIWESSFKEELEWYERDTIHLRCDVDIVS